MAKFFLNIALFAALNLLTGTARGQMPDLLSPHTCDMFHSVSYYTGTVNMSVPLYTYKDKDFEIPIALSYNATGFVPSKREGPAGLNWALSAGGVVVRKVNGLPDDWNGKNGKGERVSPMGIWIGAKNKKLANFEKQSIFNLSVGEEKDGYWTANDVELTPDEFTFVAPGLSGWFYINFDGTIKCAGNRPFVVELKGMSEQSARGTTAYSTIAITADNGYKYVFGGSNAEKEWSIYLGKKRYYGKSSSMTTSSYDPSNESPKIETLADDIAIVTAWHLVSITAPNGRSVAYQYHSYDSDTDYLYNTIKNQSGKALGVSTLSSNTIAEWKIENIENITKTVYLKRIAIGATSIHFDYLPKDMPFYVSRSEYNQKNLKLNTIRIYYNNENITDFQFNYSYLGTSPFSRAGALGKRMFLTSIKKQSQLTYEFDYYIPEKPFPDPQTLGIDHWGFWNGKDENTSLIPAARNIEDDILYTETIRDPDATYCNVGLLKSITYPTKGKTTFFYEPNRYAYRIERRSENDYLPALYKTSKGRVNDIAGGARIAAVEYTDGKNVQRISYSYPTEGILMSWPQYTMLYELMLPSIKIISGQTNSFAVNSYPGEPFIHYPEVIETRGENTTRNKTNGYIRYIYTSYLTLPDNKEFETKQHGNTANIKYLHQWRQLGKQYSSRYFERGLLIGVQVYDAENRMMEQKQIAYSDAGDYPDEWIASVAMGEFDANTFKIYHYPIVPTREMLTQYFDNDSLVTAVDYDYHSRKDAYLVSKTTIASDGTELKTEYHYIDGRRDNAEYAAMREKNIRNIPVETIAYKDGAVIGASLINFKSYDDLKNWKIYPSEVLQLETNTTVTDFDEINIDKRLKPQITYERYDSYGNVLQQRSMDGLTVSYLWDYSGLYKLAEIVGATYEDVQKAATGMNLSVTLPDDTYLRHLQTLREKLPQALITNYTYKPLVGITSQTGPNGITTYYEYDEQNRLKRVRNHEGKVIKEQEIHYFNER